MAKLLLVDDQPAYLKLLGALLVEEGFEVQSAASGREALDVGASFVPDVLVVDWMLQDDMDGLEVAEALRRINPEIRVIVITARSSAELPPRIESFPSACCLEKPFRESELIAAVRAASRCE
jgi:DNA-binding response OmpR family regulator